MLKQKIIQALGGISTQNFRKELQESGETLEEYIGLTDADIEAGRAELRPEVREKLEGVNYAQ